MAPTERIQRRLVVIPARGGSKGIPRKNLRLLKGKPLIYFVIDTLLNLKGEMPGIDVCVSSEDSEILAYASNFDVISIERPAELSEDDVTLDAVVHHAVEACESLNDVSFDFVMTVQPTSPLITRDSILRAFDQMDEGFDSVISVIGERHLSWTKSDEKMVPLYKERLNRQYLPDVYKETGAIFLTRRRFVTESNRLGKRIGVIELPELESIDIDDFKDWVVCEYYMSRSTIVFHVIGHKTVGYGHINRVLTLASAIVGHRLVFIVPKKSEEGYRILEENNYEVYLYDDDAIGEIKSIEPQLVINDILDTSREYMTELKALGVKVINFEDLGDGAREADLVINALYPEKRGIANHFYGEEYFVAREEFLIGNHSTHVPEKMKNILITFGGTDPNNLTIKVIDSIYAFCQEHGIRITAILGLGYSHDMSAFEGYDITLLRDVKNMAHQFVKSDLIFCSGGRTVYEIATISRPTVVLCQNERELTHLFAKSSNGFINLGLGNDVDSETILEKLRELASSPLLRRHLIEVMQTKDLKRGKEKVVKLIKDTLSNEY